MSLYARGTGGQYTHCSWGEYGCIRLSVSTVNSTYELSRITHVTRFCKYRKHSTGPSAYGPWVHTYSKLLTRKSMPTVWNSRVQSNEISTYGGCHGGIFREFVGRACCTYGQPNTTYGTKMTVDVSMADARIPPLVTTPAHVIECSSSIKDPNT